MKNIYTHLKAHSFSIALICAIIMGSLTGYALDHDAVRLKPLGDIFLHLIFTAIVPFIFFSIATAMSKLGAAKTFWQVIFNMFASFIFTSSIAFLCQA